MSTHPFRFGVSEFTTMPWSFDEDVERYARLGIDAIEVVEAKLDAGRFAEQMESIRKAGLSISGVQPKVRTFFASRMTPDPHSLDERTQALRQSIERLGRHAPGAPFITYYNTQLPHSGLAGRTPVEAYRRMGQSDHGGHAPPMI